MRGAAVDGLVHSWGKEEKKPSPARGWGWDILRRHSPRPLIRSSTIGRGSVYTGQMELCPNLPERQCLHCCSLWSAHVDLKPDGRGAPMPENLHTLGSSFFSRTPGFGTLLPTPCCPHSH